MALVTLVVVGHAWTLAPNHPVVKHLYDFLYAWHVPAFVFVTGYLSRSFTWEPHRLTQLIRTVAVPYLVFECLLALFRIHVGGERLEDLFTDPHWPMWYLSALFFWRLLTPVFRPMTGGLLVAVCISLGAGVFAGDTLDMARVLGLLPFFVMGLKATPERLDLLRGTPQRLVAVAVLVAIAFLARWTDELASTEWLYYRSEYGELDVSDSRALLTRAALLVIGTLGAWAFLSLVPRVGGWFTRMGVWTLVVYLFHGFAVKSANYAGFDEWAVDRPYVALLLTTVAGVALAFLLAWDPVARLLNHVVDPFAGAKQQVGDAVRLTHALPEADAVAEALEQAAGNSATVGTVRGMRAETASSGVDERVSR